MQLTDIIQTADWDKLKQLAPEGAWHEISPLILEMLPTLIASAEEELEKLQHGHEITSDQTGATSTFMDADQAAWWLYEHLLKALMAEDNMETGTWKVGFQLGVGLMWWKQQLEQQPPSE